MTTVFFDVDTQLDFLFPAGALYVPKAEAILPAIVHLNRFAAAHGIPLISTVDAHTENDPEFQFWPPHCVQQTYGQTKPQATLLPERLVIPSSPSPAIELQGAKQIILEKQTTDCFTNSNITSVLELLQADRYVVYGVVTEICVRNAVLGLRGTGKPIEIVTDAIQCLDAQAAAQFLQSRDVILTTSAQFL